MSTPNAAEQSPFRAGGVLLPQDPALYHGIYSDRARPASILHGGGARVICSPKLTGKTTQLSFLLENQSSRSFNDAECVSVTVPSTIGGVSLQGLQDLFSACAEADSTYSLPQVVSTSKRLARARTKILAIIGADNLEESALRWLLSSVRSIETGAERSLPQNSIILIDGSFAVDTLTRGPNSDYPLPQVYPREFNRAEQRDFIRKRLQPRGLDMEPEAARELWAVTAGDKFLTQLVCRRWHDRWLEGEPLEKRSGLSRSDLRAVVQSYVDEPFSDEFKGALLSNCWQVVDAELLGFSELMVALPGIGSTWEDLALPVRAAFYRGGAVRRLSDTEVGLRAPLVLGILKAGENRRSRVDTTLGLYLPLEGIRRDYRSQAATVVKTITRAAFCGSLLGLHVGVARRESRDGVRVKAVTLDGDSYSASWSVDGGMEVGEEAWALLWSEGQDKVSTTSHVHLWPITD